MAAVEVDPRLLPALREAVAPFEIVRVVRADAVTVDWRKVLGPAPGTWSMVANLPYNVAVPVLMRVLDEEPRVDRFLVMVQAEVGRRMCAGPGDPEYGSVSVRVAYRADASVVRPISRTVFWPRPNVDSVLVRMHRRPPPVEADEESLWRLVRESFAQRRKTMAGALVRLGMSRFDSEAALRACDLSPTARPEELGLESFACLTGRWRAVAAS